MNAVARARTLLFVPANRPDRFATAHGSGADVVILDLEDAVPPAQKERARAHAVAWAARPEPVVVRVNAVGTRWFADDVRALAGAACAIMLPKADTPDDVVAVARRRPRYGVVPLIESPAGLLAVAAIAGMPGVTRLAFGNGDLALALGIDHRDAEALRPARLQLVVAAAAAGLPAPVDGVTTALDDPERLRRDTQEARRLGFGARLCVHPRQVAAVRDGLRPTADEVAWARGVTAAPGSDAGSGSGGGARRVGGEMVDGPIVARARRVLAAADDTGGPR